MNPADPTGRVLKGKNQLKWVYGDDVIVTVGRGQIILAARCHGTGNDQGTLAPSLAAARGNLDAAGVTARIRASIADGGFASLTALTAPFEGISLIAMPRKPGGGRPSSPEYQRMAARLGSPAGRALYRRRMGMIEPVFRHLTQHGGRDLHFRGPARHTEVTIMAVAHNAGKYVNHCRAVGGVPHPGQQPLKTLTIRNRSKRSNGGLTTPNQEP